MFGYPCEYCDYRDCICTEQEKALYKLQKETREIMIKEKLRQYKERYSSEELYINQPRVKSGDVIITKARNVYVAVQGVSSEGYIVGKEVKEFGRLGEEFFLGSQTEYRKAEGEEKEDVIKRIENYHACKQD